jgi:hypothetical protein
MKNEGYEHIQFLYHIKIILTAINNANCFGVQLGSHKILKVTIFYSKSDLCMLVLNKKLNQMKVSMFNFIKAIIFLFYQFYLKLN